MHPIDRAATLALRRLPRRQKVFRRGWGDPDRIAAFRSWTDSIGPAAAVVVEWGGTRHEDGLVVTDGVFASPASGLPPAARTAHVRRIEPAGGARRVCLLMASWNDHGYRTRSLLAGHLARRGIATVILENPYYGRRRVGGDDEQPIATVADFAAMGGAAVEEGRAVLAALAAERPWTVGVSGYSMGGNIAALVGALAPLPVAVAPLAASHSPGPVFTGAVLRGAVAWEALDGVADPVAEVAGLLGRVSVLRLPAPAHTAGAVMVAARHDGFVPAAAARAVHEHWPGSEMRWVRAGHATLLWFGKAMLARGIEAAFDRFETP